MAIVRTFDYAPFDDSDPDDFRPDSRWAVLVDPGEDHGARVDDITLIFSRDGRAWGPGRGGPYPLKFFSGRGLVATVDPFPRLVLNDGKKVICD